MKKIYMLFLGFSVFLSSTYAQVSGYTFAGSVGTYTPITGTTVSFAGTDDNSTGNLPIGFSFTYNGAVESVFAASTNGLLILGQTAAGTGLSSNQLAATRKAIAALWDDNEITGGNVQYLTSGISPNRILTVQYTNLHIGGSGSTTNPTINMQILLYETTNQIQIIYGATSAALASTTASIGIGVTATNFISVTPTSTGSPFATLSTTTSNNSISSSTNFPTGTTYTFTPPSCVAPSGLTTSAITTTSATVSWSAASPAPSVGYEWAVTTSSTAPASGTATTALTASATGLTPNTVYYLHLRSNCGSGTFSSWATSTSFTTELITNPPYNEPFTTTTTPVGWNITGWTIGSTRGVTGNPGNNIYKNLYSTAPTGTFTTVNIGLVTAGMFLTFDYKNSDYDSPYAAPGVGSGDFVVSISSDLGVTYTTLSTIGNTATNTWQSYSQNLSSYVGQNVKIRIIGTWVSGDYDLAFDNIKVELPPSCLAPTALINSSITSSGANHTWTAPSPAPAVGYEWAVTTSTTPPASGTATTSTTASSTTLTANTIYYLHVRSDCGAGGFSAWATSASFTTACVADNIPYTMPITAVTIPSLPLCTSIENIGNLPNTWISNSFTGADILAEFTMPVMCYVYNSANPANDWLYTNGLNLTAGISYTLKFKYSNDLGTTYPEAMKVAYGSANNAASMTNILADYPVINSPTATNASLIFTPTSSGIHYIGFHAYSAADQDVLVLDDVEVILTPSCVPVAGITITSSTTSANLSWTAVPSAVNGYEYVIDAVATDPTMAGAPAATTSVSVAGTYILGSTYYAHVRSICSISDFSTWTTVAFVIPPACTNNIAPTNGATNLSNPIALSWTASTGATSYNVLLSSDGGNTYASVGNIAGTTANLSVLTAGTYSWYVQPSNGGLASGCATNATTFSTTPAPTNNVCADAVDLTVSNGFCSVPVIGTLAFADSTTGLGGATCSGSALKFDVWYKVTVPSSGSVTVQTSAVNTVVTDLVLEAYSGTCGTLTSIGCNDDGNPDASPSASHSRLGLIGRTPGEVIYFRVMPYSTLSNAGAFAICAFDTSSTVIPPVALGASNACTNAVAVSIDSAFKYTWATFKDASGNIIAQVYPNGNILGSTTGSFYKNDGAVRQAGAFYLDRNISITPTTQPTSGTVTVRLFYTAAELASLQAVDPTVTNTNLNINKTPTSCSPAFLGTGVVFIPQLANGSYGTDRYLDISNSSFSEFFIKPNAGVLPVSIEYFKGTKQSSANLLDWKITCTSAPSLTISLERSADGRSFKSINEENALAVRCLQAFDYTDISPLAGANYYRLKLTTPTGEVNYSRIVVLLNKEKGFELISIAPNPVKDLAVLTLTSVKAGKVDVSVNDVAGKLVAKQTVSIIAGNNLVNMNFATLGAGTYMITVINADGEIKTTRFVKY